MLQYVSSGSTYADIAESSAKGQPSFPSGLSSQSWKA